MERITAAWGIEDTKHCFLEYTGDLIKPQAAVRISTAKDWTFMVDKFSTVAKLRCSAAHSSVYYDSSNHCHKCRSYTWTFYWKSRKHCGHFVQTNAIEPFKIQIVEKVDSTPQAL